jgi:germination protein M
MMNMKHLCAALLAAVLTVSLAAGCAPDVKEKIAENVPIVKQQETKTQKPAQVEKVIYRALNKSSQKLTPVKIKLDASIKDKDQPLAVMKELVEKAPSGDTTFPKDTKVNKVTIKDGLATVDFNKAFVSRKNNEFDNMLMIYAVVDTLTEFPDIKQVTFSVEGKKLDMLGQMDMEDPFKREPLIIKKDK